MSFESMRITGEGLTFDDVLLVPSYSETLPSEVVLKTKFTKNIELNTPIVSAAMDTVTESAMAIAMAREGGIGVIHKNMSIEKQAIEVKKVKRAESGMVYDPITVFYTTPVGEVVRLMQEYNISGVPVIGDAGNLKGIITNRDLRFIDNNNIPVSDVMTKHVISITMREIDKAPQLFHEHRIEKLPVVDEENRVVGLVTYKDITKTKDNPNACKDDKGRLRVAAAIGVGSDVIKRIEALIEVGVDAVAIDTAHAHSVKVLDTLKLIKANYNIDVVVGNVGTYDGAKALIDAGADGIKVGIGPGCFVAGTRILMANGFYKNIEDIKVGDLVINGNGKIDEVVGTKNSGIKEVVKYKHSLGIGYSYATPDHEHKIADIEGISQKIIDSKGFKFVIDRGIGKRVKWETLENIKEKTYFGLMPTNIQFDLKTEFVIDLNDYSVQKHIGHGTITDSYESGYVFGMFLGDGNASVISNSRKNDTKNTIGRVTWYINNEDTHVIDKLCAQIKNLGFKYVIDDTKESVTSVRIHSLPLARFLDTFGKTENKHLPENLFIGNENYLQGLFDGLIDSDGNIEEHKYSIRKRLTNTSKRVVELYGILCYNLFGFFPSVYTQSAEDDKGHDSVNGFIKSTKDSYKSCFHSKSSNIRTLKDGNQLSKIIKMEKFPIMVNTHDIQLKNEPSFIANNTIVHNSICTTRIIVGVGVPQLSAIHDCYMAAKDTGIPVIADGGIRYSGDIVKALAAGANSVMAGSLFAGVDESPGETIIYNGRKFKAYRGMGSIEAMEKGSKDRYFQDGNGKLVPEGIVARVPYKGFLNEVIYQMIGGLKSGMGYCGAAIIEDLHEAKFMKITNSGMAESHPHDVTITKEAPNYSKL